MVNQESAYTVSTNGPAVRRPSFAQPWEGSFSATKYAWRGCIQNHSWTMMRGVSTLAFPVVPHGIFADYFQAIQVITCSRILETLVSNVSTRKSFASNPDTQKPSEDAFIPHRYDVVNSKKVEDRKGEVIRQQYEIRKLGPVSRSKKVHSAGAEIGSKSMTRCHNIDLRAEINSHRTPDGGVMDSRSW